jgi:hypothetical protein
VEGAQLRAYKFLRPGAIGRFSGFAWPAPEGDGPGPWVDAVPSACATGIHACDVADLPYWLDAELWEIELGGQVQRTDKKLVAQRGRLLHRIDGWDDGAMDALAAACRARVAERAQANPELEPFVGDTPTTRPWAATFVAARAAELDAGPAAYAAEREWQARWIAERLGL